MAIIVNTNMSSLKTQKNLNNATSALNKSLERMSTGMKINSAGDDAAGMYVASNLEKQIRGSKIAQSNVATGINVLQMTEGTLDIVNDNLMRIRDLAIQASNGVYDVKAMNAMRDEIIARMDEITRAQDSANFNGMNLLTAPSTGLGKDGLTLQVGSNGTANDKINVVNTVFQKISVTKPVGTTDFTVAMASAMIGTMDASLGTVATNKATIGASVNRLNSAQDSLTTTIENASAAKSTIMDADISEESANYTRSQILQQTAATLLVQANQLPSLALNLIK